MYDQRKNSKEWRGLLSTWEKFLRREELTFGQNKNNEELYMMRRRMEESEEISLYSEMRL